MKFEFDFTGVLKLLGNPVTYYPSMARALGNDPGCALFLSNFYYWEGKQEDTEGWIYKSQVHIHRETGLTRPMQERVRKKLIELGCMEEQLRGMPAKLHYRFKWDRVNEVISLYFNGLPSEKQGEKKDPLLYRLRTEFLPFYLERTKTAEVPAGIEYNWTKRDWRYIKMLAEVLAERLKAKKMASGSQPDLVDDDVVISFKHFLHSLPDYHLKRNLSPQAMYTNFSKIIQDIAEQINNGNRTGKNTAAKSSALDYVS